mmetsp:Transcript_30648/g.56000  ORF Transcript_30648/g.56000 Transcript_30648/m.56000 type:complete len:365 (+) Transcript_30648:41-1135(+)
MQVLLARVGFAAVICAQVVSGNVGNELKGSAGWQPAACSCDCCVAEASRSSVAKQTSQASTSLTCIPRDAPVGIEALSDSGCAATCIAPAAHHLEAEYAEWCFSNCHAVGDVADVLCIDAATALEIRQGKEVTLLAKGRAKASGGEDVNQAMAVSIARSEMLSALEHAREAGKAARAAKAAYDNVRSAPEVAARMAGMQTVAELKREAGEQAWKAQATHAQYVQTAQGVALKAAAEAVDVYKQAAARDLRLADAWNKRSLQYAEAARKRQALADVEASQAEKFRQQKEFQLAKEKMVQAHQTINQAQSFADTAAKAHAEAVAIGSTMAWYASAEEQAGAHALGKALPPNVPAPQLPSEFGQPVF